MEQSFIRVGGLVILTPDVDASLETFKSYGIIGPWREFPTVPGNVSNIIKHGKPANDFGAKIYMCDYGDVTIELFQPLDRNSEFYQELQKMGRPFIHHVIWRTTPAFYDCMREHGVEEHMSAYFPPIDETARWYGTSSDLGFDIYCWDPSDGNHKKKYPDDYISTGAYNTDK